MRERDKGRIFQTNQQRQDPDSPYQGVRLKNPSQFNPDKLLERYFRRAYDIARSTDIPSTIDVEWLRLIFKQEASEVLYFTKARKPIATDHGTNVGCLTSLRFDPIRKIYFMDSERVYREGRPKFPRIVSGAFDTTGQIGVVWSTTISMDRKEIVKLEKLFPSRNPDVIHFAVKVLRNAVNAALDSGKALEPDSSMANAGYLTLRLI